MRVSDIASWASCEAMAFHSPPRPPGRTNVAAHVGTLAHAALAGEPAPEPDGRIAYDALTPTEHVAQVQAREIAKCGRKLLADRGWGILAQEEALGRPPELTGHLDLRCWHSDHGEAIIDLKTGQIGAAWLQVGGYLTLYRKQLGLQSAEYGGVLHVPRIRIDRDVKGTLEIRFANPLAVAWEWNMRRISEVLAGAVPTRTPGQHCGRCQITDCPVRIGG